MDIDYRFSRRRDGELNLSVTVYGEADARASIQTLHEQRGVLYCPFDSEVYRVKHTWSGASEVVKGLEHLRLIAPALCSTVAAKYQALKEQAPKPVSTGLTDPDIRKAVKAYETRILQDEVGLCGQTVRADLAYITTDELSLWEIKSDRDSLTRLPEQVRVYSGITDYAWIVTTGKYLEKVKDIVPVWWGVLLTEGSVGKVSLKVDRAALQNKHLDKTLLTESLWVEEARSILKKYGHGKGISRMPGYQLRLLVESKLDTVSLRKEVRLCMAARA